MPNWCEGCLKIRGKRENVLKFLTEGVNHYKYDIEKDEYVPIEKNLLYYMGEECFAYLPDDVFVEGTTRGFISDPDRFVYLDPEDGKIVCVYFNFRQAWRIDAKELAAISDKYFLSFKIFAAESGMGFAQDIEIHGGQIIKDEMIGYKNYDDFVWKCPTPDNGG